MGWYGLAMTLAMAVGPILGVWTLEGILLSGSVLFAAGLSLGFLS